MISDTSHPSGLTTKERVYSLLNKNPLLTPKDLCQKLRLSYKDHHGYVAHIKSDWKYDPQNEHGSKYSLHAWRGWTEIPISVAPETRAGALSRGWIQSRARNKWLLFKNSTGRLQWFLTGRVNIYVRAPVDPGKVIQLIAQGFTWSGIITDLKVFRAMIQGVHFKGAHYVFPIGLRLPKPVTVDLFGPSNGFIVKISDRTHPTDLEIQVHFPDWGERVEKVLDKFIDRLDLFFGSQERRGSSGRPDPGKYSV